MNTSIRHLRRAPMLWLLCLWLGLSGCGQQAADEAPMRAVALPALGTLQETVRTQLQNQHAHLRALADSQNADPVALGAAYGEMGRLLLTYNFNAAAEPALLNAAALLPRDARWPYYLGYLYQKDGRLEEAADRYKRVGALQPDNVPARVHLAEVYRDLGREKEAVKLLKQTVRRDPQCAAAHFLLGQMAGPDEAISHYEAVLRLQPFASIVHYPLGQAYRARGDLENSRRHLALRGETSVRLPDSLLQKLDQLRQGSDARMAEGGRLMQQRRYREAVAAFKQVVAEDSGNALGYLNLGAALAQVGLPEDAIDALEQAVRLDPSNSDARFNLGLLYGGRGDKAQARAHFRAALEADANHIRAHFALAKLFAGDGQCREAIPHFAAFLAANPGNVDARINEALCQVRVGRYAEARALLEAGHEAAPNQLGLQDALIRVLAASPDAEVRDGTRALEMGLRLTAALPRPETLESLAMAYAEQGRFPEAIAQQKKALRMAEEGGQTAMVDPLRANLRRYEQSQPCRTPWPAFVLGQ